MVSFCTLWENLQKDTRNKEVSEKSISAIKTGLNVDENFWKNFLRVVNNTDGLSDLLDVSCDKISTWNSKIQKVLNYIEKEKQNTGKNDKLI